MPSANYYRRIADKARGIPARHGLREYSIDVLVISYSGTYPGDGTLTDSSTSIKVGSIHNPKVRFPSQREIALGMAGLGSCIVGPFTPDYGSGGVPRDILDGTNLTQGQMLQFWIVGPNFPNGCAHRLSKFQVDRALQVQLELIQVEASNGDVSR